MNAPERVGGRYRLDGLLARGGMASVHRGHDEQLGRPVAVKLLRDDLDDEPTIRQRFESEARRAASIAHPQVVSIYDVGIEDGTPYIVMELVEGGDLAAALSRDRPMAARRAARIGADVADALAAAHAAGIVHRDVKPGNVLLDAEGRARVADFGIARAVGEDSLTRTGAMLGSVEYFSPEQARGERASASSDIYALGIVLYELVTGTRPFTGDSPYSVATARLRRPPPDPRAANPDVPEELAAIIRRAMAPRPRDRFGSAAKLRDSLIAWLKAPADASKTAVLAPRAGGGPSPAPRRARGGVPLGWLAAATALLLVVAGYVGVRAITDDDQEPIGNALEVIAGSPGGEVTSPSPTALPTATPDSTPQPTPDPTADPTADGVGPGTPQPTARPPTPEPTTPPGTPTVVAIADEPADAVLAFYRRVADGDFDSAHALWSDRMRATYPRQENLDDRFADTASIEFFELRVASQSASAATVQANFTERYDAGGSRDFIGYWRLVRVDGAWLLDEPHY